MKPNWYLKEKKIYLSRWEFRLVVIFTFVLIASKSLIFLTSFYDRSNWSELVNNFREKYGESVSWTSAEGMLRLRWLMQFWSIIGISFLFILIGRLGFGKRKYGYFFVVGWIILWAIILAGNIVLMKVVVTESVISAIGITFVTIPLWSFLKRMINHRKSLYNKYLTSVKKGGK